MLGINARSVFLCVSLVPFFWNCLQASGQSKPESPTLYGHRSMKNKILMNVSLVQRAWGCLVLAIALEVLGLVAMKIATNQGSILGHFILYGCVGLAYVLLSKAVQKISVGVAYAIWEGSGIALITLVSWFMFADPLTAKQILGIALAILGIVLVNAGHVHEPMKHVDVLDSGTRHRMESGIQMQKN